MTSALTKGAIEVNIKILFKQILYFYQSLSITK